MFSKHSIFFLLSVLFAIQGTKAESALRFIENKGQWDSKIEYNVRLNFGNIYFEKNAFAFVLQDYGQGNFDDHNLANHGHFFSINFMGANPNPQFTYSGKSTYYLNFFLGNNPQLWKSNVHDYEAITYKNLYEGIDMAVRGDGDELKYEYYIAPNAAANQILVKYEGIEKLSIKNGHLFYETSICDIYEKAPFAYQIIEGDTQVIACNYKLLKDNLQVSFVFPNGYNKNYELVIDPNLVFARLSNSTSDNFGFTATYDSDGRAYTGGIIFGAGGIYPTTVGSFDPTFNGGSGTQAIDIGISCYDGTTGALLYGTYIGGNSNELPNSMIVNTANELLVLSTTGSANFPTTLASFDGIFKGGTAFNLPNNGVSFPSGSDMAIFKLSANGSNLLSSTFLGGNGNDGLNEDASLLATYSSSDLHFNYGDAFRGEIIVDEQDNVYVASSTNSSNFPLLGNVGTLLGEQDAVVFKLNPDLSNLLFSRYLGGNNDDAGYSLKTDELDNLFVVGGTKSNNFPIIGSTLHNTFLGGDCDGFIAKLNRNTGAIISSTFIGTTAYDQVYFVDIDRNNDVYIVGQTLGTYPIFNAGYSVPNGKQFIHKLNNNVSASIYSTVFGRGNALVDISPTALLVDRCERVYVSGWGGNTNANRNVNLSNTSIGGMPITQDAIQSATNGLGDFYFFVLDKDASGLLYASYYGGSAAEHVDGGTSRFDEQGIIYQAICAACGQGTFASSAGYSSNSSSNNCNIGLVKMDIGLPITTVALDAFPRAVGCVPLTVNFQSILEDVTDIVWDFGDGTTSTTPNPTHTYVDTGTYIVKLVGTNPNSCNEIDSAFLTVIVGNDTIIASQIDTFFVDCDSFDVYVAAEFQASTQYTWTMGDGTTYINVGNIVNHRYAEGGIYDIILFVEDTTKCETEAYDTLRIDFAPKFLANIGTNSACVNVAITLENLSNPDADIFSWDLGNGEISNEFEPQTTYSSEGPITITLTVIDSGTCNFISSDTTFIEIVPAPIANFTIDSSYYLFPDNVQFTNLSIQYDQFLWEFGDGKQDSTNLDPLHFYNDIGSFTPCLKVSNDACEDTMCLDLFIDFIPEIGIPNAFSPNNDNINDIIYVEGLGIRELNFKIFNRWGELVFESYQQNEGWDGTFNGVLQEMEVYTYVVNAVFLDDSQQILKGNISLLK